MADEQTPQSDLIDDAIRQAERQLEAKLEALRMSALGETTEHVPSEAPDDVAVLRPTGAISASSGDELVAAPTLPTSSSGVSGLTASWSSSEPEPTFEAAPEPAFEPVSNPTPALEPEATPPSDDEWTRPEPVHASWTGQRDSTPPRRIEPAATAPAVAAGPIEVVPSEEEVQFRAQTRTALRNLQQVSETLPNQVTGTVVGEVERIVRDELAAPNTTLRMLQQNVQQGLPQLAERLESALQEEVEAPTTAIRQVQEELPTQLERVTRDVTTSVSGELDRITSAVQGTVTRDVGQLEQSIATNVTRMAQGIGEGVSRIERSVTGLDESVARYERGVRGEFDRIEASLRTSVEQARTSLSEELVQPTETVRKLDDEMPTRFSRLERTIIDEVQGKSQSLADQVSATRRDLSDVLASLVDANRVALERLAQVTQSLDRERTQRAEDLEFLVDAMTTGWDGMASAVTALFEQGERTGQRIAVIEERLVRTSEALTSMERHVMELQPAPVMVTVNHPDASVSQVTKGGYLLGDG